METESPVPGNRSEYRYTIPGARIYYRITVIYRSCSMASCCDSTTSATTILPRTREVVIARKWSARIVTGTTARTGFIVVCVQ